MNQAIEATKFYGRNLRSFERLRVPPFSGLGVEFGPLGRLPAESVPLNISRGGFQSRTGTTMFQGTEGEEIIIRFADSEGRLVPNKALGWVRRVEERHGYFMVSVEFAQPLEQIAF